MPAGATKRFYMHLGQESQQLWAPSDLDPGEDGGVFWLPGRTLVELRMLSEEPLHIPSSSAHPPAASNGAGAPTAPLQRRGFAVILGWMPQRGTLISERPQS